MLTRLPLRESTHIPVARFTALKRSRRQQPTVSATCRIGAAAGSVRHVHRSSRRADELPAGSPARHRCLCVLRLHPRPARLLARRPDLEIHRLTTPAFSAGPLLSGPLGAASFNTGDGSFPTSAEPSTSARMDRKPSGSAEDAGERDGSPAADPSPASRPRRGARHYGGVNLGTGQPIYFQSPLSQVTGFGYAPDQRAPAKRRKRRRRKSRPTSETRRAAQAPDEPWWAR